MITKKNRLKNSHVNLLFKKEYLKLKIKVFFNWLEISTLILISIIIILKTTLSLNFVLTLLIISSTATTLFIIITLRDYKLKINRFDKEDIHTEISQLLIEQTKNDISDDKTKRIKVLETMLSEISEQLKDRGGFEIITKSIEHTLKRNFLK